MDGTEDHIHQPRVTIYGVLLFILGGNGGSSQLNLLNL
jgi:hypothetical protein